MLPFILIPLLAFVIAYGLTPLTMAFAHRWGAAKSPTRARDKHSGAIPRLGGVAIGVAFIVAVVVSRFLPVPTTSPNPNEWLTIRGLLLGSGVMLIFGALDDKYDFSSAPQFIAQFVVTGIAIYHEIFIERFNNPFADVPVLVDWWVMVPLTAFWFLGTMNTVNWLDGLDGLADGVVAIACAIFAIHMFREGQLSVALIALALMGATLGILPFNFNPARTFIGSSGSFFLGYALAAVAIMAGAKVATMMFVLGLPILDTAWQIINRLRQGRSPMSGDRGHLHHRLLDMGFSQRQVVVSYYIFCAVCGILALAIPARIYKLYAIGILGLGCLVFFWWLAGRKPQDAGRGTQNTTN
jgi:UDP-GlcNAc:undecaprenyl-phosphate GlcNAc-1-phosphate transferase